jgi:hypothetical protein
MKTESDTKPDSNLPPPQSSRRAPLWAKLVATFFGAGLLHPGPGSWASAATVFLWWLVSGWINPHCDTGLVEISVAGLYTFPSIRYRETSASASA